MRRIILLAALFSLAASPTWQIERSIVSVQFTTYNDEGEPGTHYCTGFVVDAAKGYVLTAEHCVPKDDKTPLLVADVVSEVIKKNADLAIVKIEPMSAPPLEIGGEVEILDPVIVIGYGYKDLHRFRRNVSTKDISDRKKKVDLECELIGLDGPLAPGMSGGPILKDGKVVGISQATAPSIGLGCNAKEIKKFIK